MHIESLWHIESKVMPTDNSTSNQSARQGRIGALRCTIIWAVQGTLKPGHVCYDTLLVLTVVNTAVLNVWTVWHAVQGLRGLLQSGVIADSLALLLQASTILKLSFRLQSFGVEESRTSPSS